MTEIIGKTYEAVTSNRKIYLAIGIIVAGMAMCYAGKITGGEWVELTQWVAVAYLGANVAEKHTDNTKEVEVAKVNLSPL